MVMEKNQGGSVNSAEVDKFNQMASEWWDPSGPLKLLFTMNGIRVPFIRDGLLKGIMDRKEILNSSSPLKGFTLLEIGCGGGLLTEALGKQGATVIAIDPAEDAISMAKNHLPSELEGSVTYICTSIEKYYETNPELKFDAVILSEVVDHVDNPESFIQTSLQLLKSGGSVFLTTPGKTIFSWFAVIILCEYVFGFIPKGTHKYNKFISPHDSSSMLQKNGCNVKSVQGGLYNPLVNNWIFIPFTSVWYAIHAIKI